MRCYKLCCSIIIYMILTLCLVACRKTTSNGLFHNASPKTSALALYVYDGEKVVRSFIYDNRTEQSILDTLDAVKAKETQNWSLESITQPIYGLEIGKNDGNTLRMAWSNGYLITQEGTVYKFDFDFAKLEQDYLWKDKDEFSSIIAFPCSRLLTQDENGWNTKFLPQVTEQSPPAGIAISLESWEKDTVTVSFVNNSDLEWIYGEYYTLQVLLDRLWYEIPTIPGNWGFNDIAYILKEGETQSKSYYLKMYGDLPTGTYRLVVEDLFVESAIP